MSRSYFFHLQLVQTSRITPSPCFLFPVILLQSQIRSPASRSIPGVRSIGSLASSGRRLFSSGQATLWLASAILSWALVLGHGGGRNRGMFLQTCRRYHPILGWLYLFFFCPVTVYGTSRTEQTMEYLFCFLLPFRVDWISAPPLTSPRGDRMVMVGHK